MTAAQRDLPHQSPDQIATSRRWRGFVGADNVEALAERIKRIVVPGRTFVITHQNQDFAPAEVKAGQTLEMGGYREGITWSSGDGGGGLSVRMGPGITGFSVGFDRDWDFGSDPEEPPHPMTGAEVRAKVNTTEGARRFYWSWIEINGGGDDHRTLDERITIIKCNEHGYREVVQVIPADIAWQQRHERDAIALDQLAVVLGETDPEEFHPAHGIDREAAGTAADAARRVAANLRKWREPLADRETFPTVKDIS